MIRTRLILLGTVLLSAIALYSLPRVVVQNESPDMAVSQDAVESSEARPEADHGAQLEIPEHYAIRLGELKQNIRLEQSLQKKYIFADSLAEAFRNLRFYDSAAWYYGELALAFPGVMQNMKAGNAYYDAFGFGAGNREEFGQKARDFYQKVLESEPGYYEAKVKMALTYVSGPSPMTGITMLRQVLVEDPGNELALYNMGLLAMTSGQYDRAIERFAELLGYHPDNQEARFYLGLAYLEQGESGKAKENFDVVARKAADPQLQATAKQYIDSLN